MPARSTGSRRNARATSQAKRERATASTTASDAVVNAQAAAERIAAQRRSSTPASPVAPAPAQDQAAAAAEQHDEQQAFPPLPAGHEVGFGIMATGVGTDGAQLRLFVPPGERPEVAAAVAALLGFADAFELLPALQRLLEALDGPPPQRGLSAEQIASATTLAKGTEALRGTPCTVCCAAMTTRQTVRTLPCGHSYHPKCIDEWLSRNDTCPLCRAQVVPAGEECEAPSS